MKDVKHLADEINKLAKKALETYQPIVKEIISSNNNDIHYIERTLEGLLDIAFEENMLLLYRKLCRYLFEINPQLAVDYVSAYREMWDEEGTQFGKLNN